VLATGHIVSHMSARCQVKCVHHKCFNVLYWKLPFYKPFKDFLAKNLVLALLSIIYILICSACQI